MAQSPFDLKPYAPWIMRFIRSLSSVQYKADRQNHLSYLPEVEILQSTLTGVYGKCKTIIDEEIHPLDGQFCQPISISIADETASQDTAAKASKQTSEAPCVMTDHELLISLHQKVDKHHWWGKRQFVVVQANMTVTHNAVRKNRYYLHEIFDHNWATLSHLKTDEELVADRFQMNFDWAEVSRKKFKKAQVPPLKPSRELHHTQLMNMKLFKTQLLVLLHRATPTLLALPRPLHDVFLQGCSYQIPHLLVI